MPTAVRKSGILLILLTGVLWSLNAPLVKLLSPDPYLIVALRSLIAGAALSPFLLRGHIPLSGWTAGLCLSYAALSVGVLAALRMTSVPIAGGMQFTAPVWLYLLQRKRGEPFRLARRWPLLVLLLGIGVFFCSRAEGITLRGNLLALSSSFTFAAMTYCSKRCACENPLGMTALSNLVTGLLVLLCCVRAPLAGVAAIPGGEWLWLLFMGVVQTGVSYACYYTGLRFVSPQTAAQLTPLEMVLGPVWVALFFREYPDAFGVAGVLIVLVGVVGEARMDLRGQRE